jgi:hypothetical protein
MTQAGLCLIDIMSPDSSTGRTAQQLGQEVEESQDQAYNRLRGLVQDLQGLHDGTAPTNIKGYSSSDVAPYCR